MNKTQRKQIGSLLLAAVILVGGGFFLMQKTQAPTSKETKDELTGAWRAEGAYEEGKTWFVEYAFKNGAYEMKSDSPQTDYGTYAFVKRFEDKSVQISKTSIPQKTTYDQFITVDPNGTSIIIDGAIFKRLK